MTPQDLIAAFETLADAPGGVAALRVLVTDMALRGLLVQQRVSDGDAQDLAVRLEIERETYIKANALKRMPKVPDVDQQCAPHGVPATWTWVPMCLLARAQAGFAFKSNRFNEVGEGLPLIRIRDVLPGSSDTYYSGEFRDEFIVSTGDWLVGMDGNFNIAQWKSGDALLNQRVTRFQWFSEAVPQSFAMLALQQRINELHGTKAYTTVQHLSGKQINAALIPLPPLAEQHRIVAKVAALTGLLDRPEAARDARDTTRASLRDAALAALSDAEDTESVELAWTRIAEHMDDLFTDPADVAPLRQTILQLAVRGRLVRQEASDEPASVLLERIAAEKARLVKEKKIRKPKVLPPIEDDEVPFDVPEGWEWCRLGAITVIQTGKLDANASSPTGQFPFFTCAKHPIRIDTYSYDTECVLIAGNGNFDVNYYEGPFDAYQRTYIVEPPSRGAYSVPYLYRFMQLYSGRLLEQSIGGVIRYIKIGFLTEALFPIPPLAEQHRIVAKVDALMALCDDLEARLTAARTTRGAFAAAAVHHLDTE